MNNYVSIIENISTSACKICVSGLRIHDINLGFSILKAFQPRLFIGRLGQITATTANISQLEGEALASKGQLIGH